MNNKRRFIMKKRMITAVLLIAAVLALQLSSCKKEEKKAEEKKLLAAMATDVGGLGDKSFNDGAYHGLELVRDKLGAEIRVVESKQQTDYVPNLSGLAEDGSDIVFAVGFLMADAVKEAAKNNPGTKFAGIDIWAGEGDPSNFLGILYKEHESGYLAGVVAGMMTKEYASASPKFNDKNVVGVVLGMFIPPVEKFEVGFIQGVQSVNPDCKVLSVTTGSFVDQAKGKEAALAMIEQGADIVFQVAGLTGLGVIQACREKGVAAIGVDVDQSGVAPDTVLTSAVKQIPQTVYLAVESVKNGTFTGGAKEYGIQEDATGISPFHDFESAVPQAVKDKVAQVTADMKAGKIKIETTRAAIGK
jgi:basic membrane protein A and related proteins